MGLRYTLCFSQQFSCCHICAGDEDEQRDEAQARLKVTRKGRFVWETHCCMGPFLHRSAQLIRVVHKCVCVCSFGWRWIIAHLGWTWGTVSVRVCVGMCVWDVRETNIIRLNIDHHELGLFSFSFLFYKHMPFHCQTLAIIILIISSIIQLLLLCSTIMQIFVPCWQPTFNGSSH